MTQLIDELLIPIRNREYIDKDICSLNLDTDEFSNKIHYIIDPETFVLVEGVLLFRPPVTDYLDIRVFLDITFEEVLCRAEIRDVPKSGIGFLQKYRDKYIPIQKRYINEYDPKANADIVIDNNNYRSPKIIDTK